MNRNNFNELMKKEYAKDWTDEEFYEFMKYAAKIESDRIPAIKQYKTAEDIAHEEIAYGYDKSARGKQGIIELRENCTSKYFANIMFVNCRNNINSFLRKPKNKVQNVSLEDPIKSDDYEGSGTTLELMRDEEFKDNMESYMIDKNNERFILEKFNDEEDKTIVIKYKDGKNEECFFSERKLAKLYLDLFKGRRISVNSINEYLFYTGTEVNINKDKINSILHKFKELAKSAIVLGGTE